MSSAAIQLAHQNQASALNTPPLVQASPASRHHHASSTHSSPTREACHASLQPSAASQSPASRRPSRRPSPNDNSASPASQSNSPMSSRAAVSSPVAVTGAPEYHTAQTERERRKHHQSAPIAPPRTSSHQQQAANGGAPSGRKPVATASQNSARRATQDPSGGVADYQSQGDQSSSSSRRKERHHAPAPQDIPSRGGSSRDPRAAGTTTSMPIRPPPAGSATASSSKGPSREASEILNSILVSQPEVDIDREKERQAQAHPHAHGLVPEEDADDAVPPPIVAARSRHDHSKREKQIKFGEYILGNTIGEGEFGKVKLGWKQEGGVQVAIKLIKKDALGSNPNRMAKIMREVAILKQLTHPNIVRLHKMEESERHYGIVLEYASGGELFDYILNHRYLKDNAARRLFAQLVSGVGYLHKKGIVHRDLKLENLLLDRNRNIIITDFGFANTFDPNDELTEEEEGHLADRDFVKRSGLDKVRANNHRKGDLMQTSCGSPCYAAPELVVSDSLYTGRKVDVWSCGVILYAMLAGYLPFDDDPANPEGDNINLLYKYIVTTTLTFPEYVTPHAKDLLRRILVPNPRRRADLFEVARHSWLSEYAHVVEFITSSTTTHTDIQNTTVPAEDMDGNGLGRSASVRESSKKTPASPTVGGLANKHGGVDPDEVVVKQQRDNKRRTVQVEYVAPTTQTQRGEPANLQSSSGKTRARSGSDGPVEVSQQPGSPNDKPLPRDPPVSNDTYAKSSSRADRGDRSKPPSSHRNQVVSPTTRSHRDGTRVASETAYMTSAPGPSIATRPATGGSMNAAGSRASYGQPLPPTVAGTNVHGRIQQPSRATQGSQEMDYGRPSISVPSKFAQVSGFSGDGADPSQQQQQQQQQQQSDSQGKGHRRSSTLGEITGKVFGRSGSLFGKQRKRPEQLQQQQAETKPNRKYPPVSMSSAAITSAGPEYESRPSIDSKRSRRSFSFGLGKKQSGSMAGSQTSLEKQNRRFSFIPAGLSLKSIGLGKDNNSSPSTPPANFESQHDLPIQEPPQLDQHGRYIDQRVGPHDVEASGVDGMYAQLQDPQQAAVALANSQQQHAPHQPYSLYGDNRHQQRPTAIPSYLQSGSMLQSGSESSINDSHRRGGSTSNPQFANYRPEPQYSSHNDSPVSPSAAPRMGSSGGGGGRAPPPGSSRGVLQKNKRFTDAYDTDEYSNSNHRPHGHGHDHGGSSGAARRVMDFFRRRGKARGGEER